MTDPTMATLLEADGRVGLRFVRHLAHAPEKVWRALTDSEHLQHWMPCDIVGERRAGATVELPFWPEHVEAYDIEDPVLAGEIRVWDPPNVFEWTWDSDLLRWELVPDGDGTVLTFTTWFGEPDRAGAANAGAGYHVCLDHLVELLDTGTVAQPLVSTPVAPWEERYRELTGVD